MIVTPTFWDRGRYTGNIFYDLSKAAMSRPAFGLAQELRPHGVASVAVSPGWMRTEFVLANFRTSEEQWQDVPALSGTESVFYVGRAVVALACDPAIMERSGNVYRVGDLAREYGFRTWKAGLAVRDSGSGSRVMFGQCNRHSRTTMG
ncbi:hypothetical protein [Mesorhizobium sp. M0500]|uniref:hypothetical protein n=1 Tax=unclassified Mesorhizobium TaxID=325217 RepID=UPI00333A9A4A